jgi:hypothetical protein
MTNPLNRKITMYTVEVSEHDVPPRWHIGSSRIELGGRDRDHALDRAALHLAIVAGIPPLRSLRAVVRGHVRIARDRTVEVPMQ